MTSLELCECGNETSVRGILCEACEKELFKKLDQNFTSDELWYLKEVYYLLPLRR